MLLGTRVTLVFNTLNDGETNRSITLIGSGGIFDVNQAAATQNLTGPIGGNRGLTKAGPGRLFVAGNPSYSGPTLVSAGILNSNGGLETAGGGVTVAADATLQARNTVNRSVSGAGTITTSGGLFIGDASSNTGFAFDGTLNVGTNQVVLRDANTAQLGATTKLEAGGRLNSSNGITLGNSRTVIVDAGASANISGSFANNGSVTGPAAIGQFLTLENNVTGTGNYSGNIRFVSSFSPGNNGPASILLENSILSKQQCSRWRSADSQPAASTIGWFSPVQARWTAY